jgi:two-component system chemotaxis sensor kinase CheA
MIRNAVDHGIDSKQERLDANKMTEGTIELSLSEVESGLTVTLKDDGRGIDPIFLRKRAIEKELITEEQAQALSDQEAMHLLFRPGFSTAAAVTDISGRGVGMDAVKSMVREQGGHIEIASTKGRGTTFSLVFSHAPRES